MKKPEPPVEGTEIVGIHFPQGGKVYYFDPGSTVFCKGEKAIVETARGAELGEVALPNRKVPDDTIVQPLKPVIRKATPADLEHDADNKRREKECEKICLEKITARGLDMKLVGAQYTFDNSKLIFYFTAAQRVDFRELVKDLASVFHTRIELRQIGIRDEARMLGGKGSCGRKLCCSAFLPNYAQVTIKMAKEQGLALTSSKISGSCGRLMCCLRFEQAAYNEEIAALPTVDSVVDTPDGKGTVMELRPMAQSVKVRLHDKEEAPKLYKSSEIKVLVLAEVKNDEPEYTRGHRDRDRSDQIDADLPID
ncbi:MAG: stage 0 sporulation family protein [Clostridia bacterium]|nr:stage 0 sporulation family protein [Clostridia bacterium]